jgi:hypothetical protein
MAAGQVSESYLLNTTSIWLGTALNMHKHKYTTLDG